MPVQWCGHCKRLAPTWEKLAEEFSTSEPKVHVAKIDCTTQKTACQAHGVRGYPTLKFFNKANPDGIKYSGARDQGALSSFAKENSA